MKTLKIPNYKNNGAVYLFECQKCGFVLPNYAVSYGICLECGENHNEYLSFSEAKELIGLIKKERLHEKPRQINFKKINQLQRI